MGQEGRCCCGVLAGVMREWRELGKSEGCGSADYVGLWRSSKDHRFDFTCVGKPLEGFDQESAKSQIYVLKDL